jgi:ATP-dependent DNA helicase RecQ
VTGGWATFSGGDRPVLVLTEDGRAVMRGERPARLRLPPVSVAPARGPAPVPSQPSSLAPSPAPGGVIRRSGPRVAEADPVARALFEALRGYRLALAREEGLPPYVIASDRTLRELAELRPRTLDDLRLAHGIGPHKVERYGAGLLAVVARTLAGVPSTDS